MRPSRSPARSDIDTSRTATSLPNWTRTPSIDRIVSRPLSLGGIVWARCVRYGRRGRGIPPLLHLRIVRRRQEDRLDLLDDLPGLLRFIARLVPIRVGTELLERLVARGPVGEGEDVNELVLPIVALRHPVADVLHPVLLEELRRVVAEAGVQRVELAGVRVVNPHLEQAVLLGVVLHRPGGEDPGGEDDAERGGGDQETAAVLWHIYSLLCQPL